MTEFESQDTQRAALDIVADELAAAGFADAREVGRGGFGVVYRCTQPSLDRTVAVKILTAPLDDENRARFFREQRAMGRLTGHPNIVSVLNVGSTANGRPYIVMPYHPQDSLEVKLRRVGPVGWKETLRFGVKIAGALETAHRAGILHRDVKPANILLTDYGDPQLTDFGIAHIAGAFQTTDGAITGSPAFTAPEVIAGGLPSAASDIYSLGATLFCAITAHAPFERREGERVVAQFLRITEAPTPRLTNGTFLTMSVRRSNRRWLATQRTGPPPPKNSDVGSGGHSCNTHFMSKIWRFRILHGEVQPIIHRPAGRPPNASFQLQSRRMRRDEHAQSVIELTSRRGCGVALEIYLWN